MKTFSLADVRHLEAAEGWLGLGDPGSAGEELDAIAEPLSGHQAVLHLRWEVFSAGRKWERALEVATTLAFLEPTDKRTWLHRSFALHELKQTAEARENLLRVVDQFPNYAVMRYNLACYECQLGRLEQAKAWLKKAYKLGNRKKIKLLVLEDPDLEPLWEEVGAP